MNHRSAMVRARVAAFSIALLAAPAFANAQTPAAAPAAGLPDAKVILEDYNKAIGGREAVAKIQSIHMVGAMAIAGQSADFESFTARPNKSFTKVSIQGMEILQGFDGEVGWSMNPMQGPQILEGAQLDLAKEGANFNSTMRDPATYKSVETVSKTTLDGKECYRVKLVTTKGTESFECYALDSHLLVGSTAVNEAAGGEATSLLRNYKPFGGVLFPTQMVVSMGPMEQEMNFSKIEVNNVDPAKFALPAEIKAIVKK